MRDHPRPFYPPLVCGRFTLPFDHTLIIGILNVTPDSFSDGGQFCDVEHAFAHAQQMVEEGADIIDVGGESSRPGAATVSVEEELARVIPVIERLVRIDAVPLSVDTYKPEVAEACLERGVHIVNDITGLRHNAMIKVVAEHQAPAVIMHMRGMPKDMQENPVYGDVVHEVKTFLADRVAAARAAGITQIMVDPGIGFGKTLAHNLDLFRRLGELINLGCPLLIGPSRKSFIGAITGLPVHERLEGTLAAVTLAAWQGAAGVRVHDVRACKRALQVIDAIKETGYG